MQILVANDDGVDAPGLHLLADAARALGGEVWVVAPETKWTAASHRVSFDRELTLTRRAPQVFACDGTPVDGVVAAMTVLGLRPGLVLAGINDKRNVGEDIGYSGTLAIAREAAFWGVPAISVSADACPTDEAQIGRLLRLLWERRADWVAGGAWLSVNLPPALPAPIVQGSLARDKIAAAADVVAQSEGRVVYRLRRGRPGTARVGDENALLAAGNVVVVRHAWHAHLPLPEDVVAAWRAGWQ
ncbi:MAG: 5'/3'-nucleotidase SurE [Burkholderiales bacterium]|nr:5'/3'-nucleotidase SurE [Burkholderiales bacterium]